MTSGALVLGSSGMLGHELLVWLRKAGLQCTGLSRADGLDVLSEGASGLEALLAEQRSKPEWCINCTAFTATAAAERTKDGQKMSWLVNAYAPKLIADACFRHGVKLMHISTDYVHSELGKSQASAALLKPDAVPSPKCAYGLHKLLGDMQVLRAYASEPSCCAVLRTSWLYGMHGSKSFLHKLVVAAATAVKQDKGSMPMVADELSVPASCSFVCECIADVMRSVKHGILHAVPYASKPVSRLEFAQLALSFLASHGSFGKKLSEVKLEPVLGDGMRPCFSALETSWPSSLPWEQQLKQFIDVNGDELVSYAKCGQKA